MFPIRRRSFLFGGSALFALGAGPKVLAQPAPSMTPHEKELYEAAKKEGGELTWYTAQSDDITAQALGRNFEAVYPGIKVNVVRTTAQVAYQRVTQEIKASAMQVDVPQLDRHRPLRRIEGQEALGKICSRQCQQGARRLQELRSGRLSISSPRRA